MKFLREPLLHFIILGAVIFLLFNIVNKDESERSDKIVITTGKVQHLADTFALTWQRPPSQEELDMLVRDYIREEVLYREAITMGLDENDTVIRRRLRQKMEFISEDVASQIQFTEEKLQNYLENNREKFKTETTFTFNQIYLNQQDRGDSIDNDIENLLSKLNKSVSSPDISTLGDRIMLESEYLDVRKSEVARTFGENFAEQLEAIGTGNWKGPVSSGYGVHLVLIEERTEGNVPPLKEIRELVERELENEKRIEANEQFYQGLLKDYEVVIEHPAKLTRDKRNKH